MAAPSALVTLAEAKIALGIALDDTSQDVLLSSLIDSTSDFMEAYCSTAFVIRAFTEHLAGAVKRLFLRRYPLVSVTSITDPDGNTVPSTDYILRRERGILEHWGRFPVAQTTQGQPCEWEVVYQAGRYAAVQNVAQQVKLACTRLLNLFVTSDGTASSVSVGSLSVSYLTPNADTGWVPPQVDALLAEFRSGLVA